MSTQTDMHAYVDNIVGTVYRQNSNSHDTIILSKIEAFGSVSQKVLQMIKK